MKVKKVLVITLAAVAGYLLAKDKAHKEMVKRLVKYNAFEDFNEIDKNVQMNLDMNKEEN